MTRAVKTFQALSMNLVIYPSFCKLFFLLTVMLLTSIQELPSLGPRQTRPIIVIVSDKKSY